MNWFSIAQRDYGIYGDKARIKNYVINGKITAYEYFEITGEEYVA